MRVELTPAVNGLDEVALRRALEAAGLSLDPRPKAVTGHWARAALREAVDNQPRVARQALSPRSTRGATRA